MVQTITHKVRFDATPEALFDLYLDSRKHTAATGGGAKMSRKAGEAYSAWDGYITGTNLAIVPKRLIVQTWRASDWDKSDPDSVLVLSFSADAKGSLLDMVHAGVPDDCATDLDEGWKDNYWTPWKRYLREKGDGRRAKR